MRVLVVLALLGGSCASAAIVSVDRIAVNVGPFVLVSDVYGPESTAWLADLVLSARLTNTGEDPVFVSDIGGGWFYTARMSFSRTSSSMPARLWKAHCTRVAFYGTAHP